MSNLWLLWGFVFGISMTLCADDWNSPIKRKQVLLILACMAAGIGLPILFAVVWPSGSGEMWMLHLVMSSDFLILSFTSGFIATLFARWLMRLIVQRMIQTEKPRH